MKGLRGEAKKRFKSLLHQVGEYSVLLEKREETIMDQLEGHARDRTDKITDIEDSLSKEQALRESLEEIQT